MTLAIPPMTDAEWRRIQAVLPPYRRGPRRKNDRGDIAELLYRKTMNWSLYEPDDRVRLIALGNKCRNWQRDGTWPAIVRAGEGYTQRVHRRWRDREWDPQSKLMARLLA